MRKTTLLFVPIAILCAGEAGALQVPQETAQQSASAPTFRAGTRLVEVDVVVRNKSGPVQGLTQDDFTLLDNSHPQKISVFSVKGKQNSTQPPVPLPRGTVSNRLNRNGLPPVNSTIILIDRMNTSPEDQYYAKQKIVKYLETRRAQDRLGIYTLGGGIRVIQDLTDDPDRLANAVNALKPRSAKTRTLDVPGEFENREPEMTGRVLDEYQSLVTDDAVMTVKHGFEAIARHLAPVPGRKSLIWVTGGFPLIMKTEHGVKYYTDDMKEAAQALNDANVALYPVDARGLVFGGLHKPGGLTVGNLDTLNFVAGETGGKAYYADNGINNLIEEAVEDSELIYTLGFYPSQESQAGDWHKLKVEVDRHGVTVRSREAYFASKVADAAPHPTLDQLLRYTLDASEIGLRAETAPDPRRPGVYNVRAVVDLHDVQLTHQDKNWVGAVNLSLYVEGTKSASRITRKIEFPEDQLAAALENGAYVDASVTLAGPTGELRVVVQDVANGAGGSLRVPLRK